MKKLFTLTLTLVLSVTSLAASAAHITVLQATLSGEEAGTSSTGAGSLTATYNSDTMELTWLLGWEGLSGPVTAAHLHGPAMIGENAGIQVPLDASMNPAVGGDFITMAQAGDLLNELWYVNLHTEMFPAGEIRGQLLRLSPDVSEVPVPAAAWLMGSGLAGLAALRRRRKSPAA